jgi:hypothetical protein
MIEFCAETHAYVVNGCRVARSCTALANAAFATFDAAATVAAFYPRWKATDDIRYRKMLGLPEAEAKAAIMAAWTATRVRGTHIHKCAEEMLTGTAAHAGVPEITQIRAFIAEHALTFCAAELRVYYEAEGTVVSAGTVDALFVDAAGEHVLVDWKRSATALSMQFRRCGSPPLGHLGDCALTKYSLQLALYARMLRCSHGITVKRAFLVRVHPELRAAQVVEGICLAREAQLLLDAEAARLHNP